jgi:hypothetical protein
MELAEACKSCPDCGHPVPKGWCTNCGWPTSTEDELTHSDIAQFVSDAQEEKADPADARRLLERFCQQVEAGNLPDARLLEHLQVAFRKYLVGGDLEAALGLKRGKGHPSGKDEHIALAVEFLSNRLTMDFEDAVDETATRSSKSDTVVKRAWTAYKEDALNVFLIARLNDPLTPSEGDRIKEIYRRELPELRLGAFVSENTAIKRS